MPTLGSFIYLDNAATTQVIPEIAQVMVECAQRDFANPASAHHLGARAAARVATARAQLLVALGDQDGGIGDVYFTSGGTEADGLAVIGGARARRWCRSVVYSAIEHPAVRDSAALMARDGIAAISVPVTPQGVVDIDRLVDAVDRDTGVVAVMLVNNELGTIQPVAEVARAVKERNPGVHVHCDAVQALGKVDIDVASLGADSIAVSAHKLHGPKGVGGLWLRHGAEIAPLWAGGGQQGGVRSGTLAVPGIAALGKAAEMAVAALVEHRVRWAEYAGIVCAAAGASGVPYRINGAGAPRAPHIVSLSFAGMAARGFLHVLESRGVLVSMGSACSAHSQTTSPVLQAIGVPEDHATIRISFGRTTSRDDIERAADILAAALADF